MSIQSTIFWGTFGYVAITAFLYILTPLMFRIFGWQRNPTNLNIVPLFVVFWPITTAAVILHLILTEPHKIVVKLHDKMEELLSNRESKKKEEEKPKALPQPTPNVYKEASYRDMNCTHCGHLIARPVPGSGVTRAY